MVTANNEFSTLNLKLSFFFQQMWVFDEEIGMNQREITYVPGLYKIFDEILGEWIQTVRLTFGALICTVNIKVNLSLEIVPL